MNIAASSCEPNPFAVSSAAERVRRGDQILQVGVVDDDPVEAVLVALAARSSLPDDCATASVSWSTSSNALRNSPDDCGLNAIAAAPAVFNPSSVWQRIAAVGSMKSWSSFGSASFLRPKRTSRRPKCYATGRPMSRAISASAAIRFSSGG